MKKFTKFLLSAAAITTVSAAMAVSAMAEDTITGSYDSQTGIVTLTGVNAELLGDQQTLLVLNDDVSVTSDNASDVIKQIDQDASITQFVLDKGLTSGTYYIRMGGSNGQMQTGTLTLNAATEQVVIGLIVSPETPGASDAAEILKYAARLDNAITDGEKSWYAAAYCTGDANMTAGDAAEILKYAAKIDTEYVGTTVDIGAYGTYAAE